MLNLLGHIPAWRSAGFLFFFFNFFYCSFDTQGLISEFSVYTKVVQRGSCCLVLLLLFETSIYIMEEIVNGALSSLRPFLGLEFRFFCSVVLTHKT